MPEEIELTPTSYIVLGLLSLSGKATPYDLKRAVSVSVGQFWTFPHSQLYAEPARLAQAGYLTEERETEGRRRKLYELTSDGRAALEAWLGVVSPEPYVLRDPALLKLFFGADPDGAGGRSGRDAPDEARRIRSAQRAGAEGRPARAVARLGARLPARARDGVLLAGAADREMTIERMDHVGVVVEDLAAATGFFLELGLVLKGEASVEGGWVDRVLGLEGVRSEIAMLETPDGARTARAVAVSCAAGTARRPAGAGQRPGYSTRHVRSR